MYTLKFKNCDTIYPHKLVRTLGKNKVDDQEHLRDVLQDILENQLRLLQYIGDNPKRCKAKKCKSHSAWYACEYCFGKGMKIILRDNSTGNTRLTNQINLIEEKINDCRREQSSPENDTKIENLLSLKSELQKSVNSMKKKSHIVWPHSTMNSQHRSRNSILAIVEKIENQDTLSIDESKGVLGRSLLLDFPDFNFTYDVPTEYMHCACLGVIKRVVELTFDVGINRPRITTRKLSSTSKFNQLMLCTKVTKEFPRRARKLDLAVFKALEYRNLVLFFFPLVIECIEINARERKLWLNLVYMIRSSVIPTVEFLPLQLEVIKECCETFYKLFEQLFGELNCPYNLHVLCCHLLEMRTHGPLTETSAFKFESFYGEVRRSFVSGTCSPLKQILTNVMLKRIIGNHVCENSIHISNYDTPMESNRLIYVYKNKEYYIYEIAEINELDISCHKVGQYPAEFPETPDILWSTVGVFRRGGTSSEITNIKMTEIAGKVLNVGKYLITCPNNVLNEK